MITAASAGKRRWAVKDDEESPYVSLPYGSPSSGQFFGPAAIGGPPCSRNSYKLRNTLSSQIVKHLQQRFQNDYGDESLENSNYSNDGSNDETKIGLHANEKSISGLRNNAMRTSWPLLDDCINNHLGHDKLQNSHNISNMQLHKKINNDMIYEQSNIRNNEQKDNQVSKIAENKFSWVCAQNENINNCKNAIFVKELNESTKQLTDSRKMSNISTSSSTVSLFESYSKIGINDQPVVAVPPLLKDDKCKPTLNNFNQVTNLFEDQCRSAMVEYAAQSCCFGNRPAHEHIVKSIKPPTTLHYVLESYTENRSVQFAWEPYKKEISKNISKGSCKGEDLPLPWSIQCEPDALFQQHSKHMEIPNSANVQDCHTCSGGKSMTCEYCDGAGKFDCVKCEGEGACPHFISRKNTTQMMPCSTCNGDKHIRCTWCSGDGYRVCVTCDGQGQIKCFLQLNVKYTTLQDDYVLEEMELPPELHEQVASGILIFQKQSPEVYPLVDYPLLDVVENSTRLVESHRSKCCNERLIQQRQSLWVLPVTEVHAEWKGIKYRYWIYGKDQTVYCPDYPHKLCGCLGSQSCSIL